MVRRKEGKDGALFFNEDEDSIQALKEEINAGWSSEESQAPEQRKLAEQLAKDKERRQYAQWVEGGMNPKFAKDGQFRDEEEEQKLRQERREKRREQRQQSKESKESSPELDMSIHERLFKEIPRMDWLEKKGSQRKGSIIIRD